MRVILANFAALLLASCATVDRVDAAGDVHAFLVSIRDEDRAQFDRHVDRTALKAQLEGRLIEEARASNMAPELKTLSTLLARPAAGALGSALIKPQVFRAVAVSFGYEPAKPLPKTLAIAVALRPIGPGRVCAAKSKTAPCLLTFEREDDTWRLVSFDGAMKQLKI